MPSLLLSNMKSNMRLCLMAMLLTLTGIVFAQNDDQYLTGNAFLVKGDYTRAVESLSMAIMRNNSDEHLYIKRGQALLKVNDVLKAIEDFNEANLIDPGVADLWLARAYALDGDHDNALKYLENHLSSAFRISEDSIKKDPAFNGIQDDPAWHSLWQKDWYNESEKTAADVMYYMKRKQYEQAVTRLDEAIVKDPDNVELIQLRGKVFLKQENYAAAAGDFSSAIKSDKFSTANFTDRGFAYLKSGRFKDAVNDYNKALKDDPANFPLYLQRAEAYAGQANWPSAIKDIQLYMKYFEDDMHALYLCGEYYYSGGDYMNALKCFNRNLKEDPNNALYFKARGKTYLKTATYRYAISDLSMALDLSPNDSETWMYHGLSSIQTGDKENGCSSLNKARKLGNTEAVRYILENCE